MVRVNEDLRQEVGFAANEALQTYGGDPLMRRSGPSGMNQVELVAIIDREQRRLAALNSSIDKTQSTLVDVKLREGSEIIRLGKTKKMAQYVTMLENRLQRSLLKHNAMHAANSSLKQVQEQMRRDISFADTLQVGINQQLKTVQDQICKRAATFDEIVAHNERSRETLTVLHRSSEQWHSTFNSDWGALSQLINDQSDDFPTPIDPIQNQERLQMLLYDPELVSLRQQSGFALEEMAEKTAIVTKYNRLEQYKRTESVLRGATGIDNIDGLVNVFIDQVDFLFIHSPLQSIDHWFIVILELFLETLSNWERVFAFRTGSCSENDR
uniref:Uncharacterized protein n=1 Tax=Spongospora subterranea TaxID=70186 RepID=A0A0H5QT92_9EUKA|eukprot:CRZ05150.1 hypothetical protein [Spongospora subterranea]